MTDGTEFVELPNNHIFFERDQAPKLHETEVNYSINLGTEQFVFEYRGHGRMDEVTPSPFGGRFRGQIPPSEGRGRCPYLDILWPWGLATREILNPFLGAPNIVASLRGGGHIVVRSKSRTEDRL